MVAKKGQHRTANQMTRRQMKILTTLLTKRRNKNVLITVLVRVRMCVKLRSKMFGNCIGRMGQWTEIEPRKKRPRLCLACRAVI